MHTARNTTAAIVRVATSMTGGVVAVADASFQVLMYAYLPYKHIKRWEFVGGWQRGCVAGTGGPLDWVGLGLGQG